MLLGRGEPPVASTGADQSPVAIPSSDGDGSQPAALDMESHRISMEEFRALKSAGAPVLIVDVRADTSFNSSEFQAQGALRIPPDQAVRRIAELNVPHQTCIILFCA